MKYRVEVPVKHHVTVEVEAPDDADYDQVELLAAAKATQENLCFIDWRGHFYVKLIE